MEKLWAPWRYKYIKESVEIKPTSCIFCDIPADDIGRDQQNLVLYRGKLTYVLCNKYPYNNGHLLIIPYRHTAELGALNAEERLESMDLINLSVEVVRHAQHAESFNVGANLGRTAGAGIEEHIHFHVVPRYDGDTNFMPVVGQTKVISQSLEETWEILKKGFDELAPH
jgi:ATP adenylyltransferase